jgi:DNA-directed RNA polymerase specialized sigma24 family protein
MRLFRGTICSGDVGRQRGRDRHALVTHSEDLALAKRVAAGDRVAFDTLFDRYVDRVHSFALRRAEGLGSAPELTERILERAFGEIAEYQEDVSLDGWVRGAAGRLPSVGS